MVIISEAPNDEVMAKAMLGTISKGGIYDADLAGVYRDEYRKIVKSL